MKHRAASSTIDFDLSLFLPEIIRAINHHTSPSWLIRHVNINGGEIYRAADEATFWVSKAGSRATFQYNLPRDLNGDVNRVYEKIGDAVINNALPEPSRTFSLARPAEDIAREFIRELVLPLGDIHNKNLARRNESNERIAAMNDLSEEFRNLIQFNHKPQNNYSFGRGGTQVQINGSDSVTLKLESISADKARQIFKLLSGL